MADRTVECPGCGAKNRVPVVTSGRPQCGKCHADLPWLVDVDAATFASVVEKSSLPVLIDLWAPWCGPCRFVAPALEQLAAERAGTIRVVKVNVDEAPAVSARLDVQGIPTMVLYARGIEVARHVGAMPIDGIRQWVDASLA